MTTAIPGTVGKVMSCLDDLSLVPKYVTKNRRVVEALYRRLSTTRGDLFYAPNYGKNIMDYLQETMTSDRIAQIPAELTAEGLKDPRVTSLRITADFTAKTKTLVVRVNGEGPEGIFGFTLTAKTETGVTFS